MDSTSITNVYRFPLYYSSQYGEQESLSDVSMLPEDISLGEYTICSKAKLDLSNTILSISKFLNILIPNRNNIDAEIVNYTPTFGSDGTNGQFFENLLVFLQSHADEFVIDFGSGMTVSPSYIHSLKKAYMNSNILQADKYFSELLNADTILDNVQLPQKFIMNITNYMFSALIEKLGKNFKCSEFCIAFNLAIMEFNIEQFKLIEKLQSIDNLKTHLFEFCQHTQDFVTDQLDNLSEYLNTSNLLEDGTIDYSGWAYEGRSQEEINRIENTKMIASIILNNSWNEVLINTRIKTMFLLDTVYPNSFE